MYFESHAHYDDGRFDKDRHEVLMACKKAGVSYIVNAGADMDSSRAGIELSKKYDFVYAAVGVHPHDADSLDDNTFLELKDLSSVNKVVAIGEIGLDFHYDNSPRDIQRKWFLRQLELATEVKLPVIIHSREASQETFDIIKQADLDRRGQKGAGVIHCYSGSAQMALEYVKLGYFLGVGGVITFPNAKNIVEVVNEVPLESILIETDCPYLSPAPNRGKRNDSQNLKYICEKISEIKQVSVETVCEMTMQNGLKFFDIK
ncbi:MAG: TatD family hydrolase [Clostridiales bacterium]|jgi:TatD DNase family protein|nr:TatD family hydrolase [Clostridiales bacterium]